MPSRYQVREVSIGRWAVWDNQTRTVAVVDGTRATGLTKWEARQTAGLLNGTMAQRSESDHA